MSDLRDIVEVFETAYSKQANEKLAAGWVLLRIGEWAAWEGTPDGKFQQTEVAYVLDRPASGGTSRTKASVGSKTLTPSTRWNDYRKHPLKHATRETQLQTYKRARRTAQIALLQWMFGGRDTPYAQSVGTRTRQKRAA